ncbi:MAG: OsmC family peroxiredoxin [Ardenticatenaceae bacterium]|nr:OsmC family peroxiredoxin [Anaerolineales bacterium]MCB8941653.1 OsmC family peroxiredoxin [Ardenticatenaceae bacterium]MCB8974452.1 OsmC family peroxiredoxin [Ardenticatenaceae bacterium]
MPVSNSTATWEGSLTEGKGTMVVGNGRYTGPFTRASRFADGEGTNPEELIGAAHAGCYSMFLAAILSGDKHVPNSVNTTAKVHIGQVDGAPTIHTIELHVEADVPGIDDATFQEYAARAKAGCPVSKALAGVQNVALTAVLKS